MSETVLVGVDAGGTTTRCLVTTATGDVLGFAEAGGGNPAHNGLGGAEANVGAAIRRALASADRDVASVDALTAGIAGLDEPADREWAESFLALDGLVPEPRVENDAVVAHAGALGAAPGIVAICGTGSIVLGIDSAGNRVRNYDVDHYAAAAARHLGRRLVHELLAGRWCRADRPLIETVLDEWGFADVDAVRAAAIDGDLLATDRSENALDTIAPIVTSSARDGVPIAETVCTGAAAEVARGIDIVAGSIDRDPVRVALLGGVLGSEVMERTLRSRIEDAPRSYDVVEAALAPVAGAVVLAHRTATDTVDGTDLADSLSKHDACRIE